MTHTHKKNSNIHFYIIEIHMIVTHEESLFNTYGIEMLLVWRGKFVRSGNFQLNWPENSVEWKRIIQYEHLVEYKRVKWRDIVVLFQCKIYFLYIATIRYNILLYPVSRAMMLASYIRDWPMVPRSLSALFIRNTFQTAFYGRYRMQLNLLVYYISFICVYHPP